MQRKCQWFPLEFHSLGKIMLCFGRIGSTPFVCTWEISASSLKSWSWPGAMQCWAARGSVSQGQQTGHSQALHLVLGEWGTAGVGVPRPLHPTPRGGSRDWHPAHVTVLQHCSERVNISQQYHYLYEQLMNSSQHWLRHSHTQSHTQSRNWYCLLHFYWHNWYCLLNFYWHILPEGVSPIDLCR